MAWEAITSKGASLLSFFFNSRYRKIPGDKCVGGKHPDREETDLKKKCTSDYLNPSQLVGKTQNMVEEPQRAGGVLAI